LGSGTPFPSRDKKDSLKLKKGGQDLEVETEPRRNLAIFYCQNIPESNEHNRQALEKMYGKNIQLFPIPCSGRLDYIHLLKALEEFADAAYVITCPEGACKYFEGNKRAIKRVRRARFIIDSIGLEKERLDIVIGSSEDRKTLATLCEELMERASLLSLSPVHKNRFYRKDAEDTERR
jgi:F420-non-reducing hydrogenase iron-sulfur subunit